MALCALQKRKNKSFADGVLEVKASGCTLYDEVPFLMLSLSNVQVLAGYSGLWQQPW